MHYLIQPSLSCFTIMRVSLTVSYLYYYITPRQSGYGDLAPQLMLLMCFLLGYTAYLWDMEAVYTLFVSPFVD